MGLFSWKCAKSNIPIIGSLVHEEVTPLSRVVVVSEDGNTFVGTYNGYGIVESKFTEMNIVSGMAHGHMKLVLENVYSGETFDQLNTNDVDANQGYFYNDSDIDRFLNYIEKF